MRAFLVVTLAATILAIGNLGSATASVTFSFDPNDLLQLYPAEAGDEDVTGENKATQANARRLHEVWGSSYYETFYNPTAPQTQPNSYNTYRNWLDGLGEGEGISAFNIWMLDNSNARSWGEQIVWDPDGATPTGTADSAGLWSVDVIENPWGAGWLVEWSTDDPSAYLNPTSTIGDFSFSGAAYWDYNANGFDESDPLVEAGESARIWFGAVNWTEEDGESTYNWSLHFDDEDWGGRDPAASPFPAGLLSGEGYGSGYEGVLDLRAIPEPSAVILLGLGLLGSAIVGRRKLRKK